MGRGDEAKVNKGPLRLRASCPEGCLCA
jgi:hypothetical protein